MTHLAQLLALAVLPSFALAALPDITPRPAEIHEIEGEVTFPKKTRVFVPAGVDADALLGAINTNGKIRFVRVPPTSSDMARVYFRRIDPKVATNPEAYTLTLAPGGITAEGSPAGLLRAAQTLAAILSQAKPDADGGVTLDALTINDRPRFAWRGYMLDESRHFSGETAVKRLLDAMARYKLNRLHWHLTDSSGWRIEIKKYPKLTEVGSRGDESNRDPKAPARFYTQAKIRTIVAYAKARGITVIPEIDMPGHADAAVRAYPEHGGGGYAKWPQFTFNPAKPETREFLNDILAEVATLFPEAGVIHFGGDEVHFGWKQWPQLPEVRELMKSEKLADNAAIEIRFNRATIAKINALGFKVGGWDEIAGHDLPKDKSLVFWWRHDKRAVLDKALDDGYPVVLCPRRPLYFDFIQDKSHKVGRTWGGFNPLADVYAFPEPLKLTPAREAHVVGIQACLWTETARTQARRDFLTWPRLVAVAEAGWTPAPRKDFEDFSRRLRAELPALRAAGLTVYDPFTDAPEVLDGKVAPGMEYLDNPE
jgi:hexosaminidase